MTGFLIRIDDLETEPPRRLIAAHLAGMHAASPAESVHALDIDALRSPAVTFWSAYVLTRPFGASVADFLGKPGGHGGGLGWGDGPVALGLFAAFALMLIRVANRSNDETVSIPTTDESV